MKVSCRNNNNRIKIVVNLPDGKRLYWSPGLPWEKTAIERAKGICSQIYMDILSGKFDGDFGSYAIDCHISTSIPKPAEPTCLQMWLEWLEMRDSDLSPTTYLSELNTVTKLLEVDSSLTLTNSQLLVNIALGKYSKRTCHNCWKWLRACFNHYVDTGTIDSNPFANIPKIFKQTKKKKDCLIFTKKEEAVIVSTVGKMYPHCTNFIRFLFATGCRPEEAIALTWDDIKPNKIIINKAYSRNTLKETKTKTNREFPINNTIGNIIDSVSSPNQLVFPTIKGRYINLSSFTTKYWKPLITQLVSDKKVSQYLSLYHCRHTFISRCIDAKIPITQIAKWVGNSPEIIWRNYAESTTDYEIPD